MSLASLSTIRQGLSQYDRSGLAVPAIVMLIIAMLVLPLPALLLDVLFTFNLLVGLVVIMIAINTRKPLDFSSFPSVLLFATMLRLALNVASTRLILLTGSGGSVILNLGRQFGGDPVAITPEQAAQFEAGVVPEELRKPW